MLKKALLVLFCFAVIGGISYQVSLTLKPPRPPSGVRGNVGETPEEQLKATLFFESWQHDQETVRHGIALATASEPKYLEALELFRKNLQTFPKASDLDYDYFWAMYCLARLKRYNECLDYYDIMRRNFSGKVIGGASGALRIWDNKLNELKGLLLEENSSEAIDIVAKMKQLDVDSASWARTLPGSE
jgi:tetratricopeptide (TPR) repeat protein